MASVVYYQSPYSLNDPTEVLQVDGCPTVAHWLEASGYDVIIRQMPTVLVLNGEELLEAQFDRVLGDDDLLVLTTLPEAQAIPVIVAWVVEYWAYIVVVAVLVGAALMLPGMLEPGLVEGEEQDSPNHNLANRGNRARMGAPKPVLYGTARIYPDLSSQAYTEFDWNGDQNVWMLYELSQGELTVDESSMRFEDTLLSSFQDADYEIIAPGDTSTLYTRDVNVSSEVSNISVESSTLGPYAANPTATTISRIGVDIVAPGGLYFTNSKGKPERYTVVLKLEAREIDDAGSPVGSWTELGRPYLSGQDRAQLRRSFQYYVTSGRYEARLSRVTAESTSTKVVDDMLWTQLRGYYDDDMPTTNTTRVAVKIRASDQLGNRAITKFNLVATRKLPIWNGTTWSSPTATTNPAWAFADACRADYGGKRADAFIDLAGLLTLSSSFATDGFECNGIFDSKMSLWDALTRICQTANCMPIDRGGIYTMVQDKAVTTPVQMFTMRNIVKDSFSIDHVGVLEETADFVRVKYYDEDQDYRLVSVDCILPSGTSDRPREVTMWGVTARDQAYELGMRMAAANRYRRQMVSFETGLEGRIPMYLDLVRVSHRLLGVEGVDQLSGDITAYNGTNTITVTESLTGLFSTPYVLIHDLQNEPKGPYTCTVIADKQIRIDESFDDSGLVFTAGYARPKFAIGDSATFHADVKVTKVAPVDATRVRIEGFIDNSTVYTITDGETPPAQTALRDLQALVPTVSKLKAAADGTTEEADVLLSWVGENSDLYEVQFSADNTNWFTAGYTRETRFTDAPTSTGTWYYRVAGLTIYKGPWASLTVNVADLLDTHAPSVPTGLTANPLGSGVELRVVVPNEDTTGAPSEVEFYRATYPDTKFADATLIDTVPMQYDSANDRYVAYLVDGSAAGGVTYYYFALPTSPNGDASDHYPTGTNDGVAAVTVGGAADGIDVGGVPNPRFLAAVQHQSGGHLFPARWFWRGSTGSAAANLTAFYSSGAPGLVKITSNGTGTGIYLISTAWRITEGTKYRVTVRWRSTVVSPTTTPTLRVTAKTSALSDGKQSVFSVATGTIDAEVDTGGVVRETLSGVGITNTWLESTVTYTPNASDKWASIVFLHAAEAYEIESCYVENLATVGADWDENVDNRPAELTDGRVSTALDASGNLQTAISAALANVSNILRYSGGGIFTGALAATAGSTWNVDISGQPADTAINNTSARVFFHPHAMGWNSYGTTSSDYSPSSSTQAATIEVRDGTGAVVATRTVTGTVTYSNGQISVPSDTVDSIAVTTTNNNTTDVTVTLTYSSKTSTMHFTTRGTTTGGVGK